MFPRLGLCALLLASSSAYAEQCISALEDHVLIASVGAQTVNRIFVEGDRINTVRGLDGEYRLEQDTQAGEIYLRPLTSHAMGLFISTVHGKHYQLQLKPTSKTAETVHLIPAELMGANERTSVLEQNLIALVRQLAKHPQKISSETEALLFSMPPDASITRITAFTQGVLLGERYNITNHHTTPLALELVDFYQPNVVAIGAEDTVVSPNSSVSLYVIRRHDVTRTSYARR